MKFYGHAENTAQKIIDQFKSGDVPAKLAPIFVNRSDDIPSNAWSFCNQFIRAMNSTNDARGFRQWKLAGRKVSKGSKAFYILAPCIGKKKEANGETRSFLYGFKSVAVFALESTEIFDAELWKKHSTDNGETERLELLPLKEVADAWGISVSSYNGKNKGYLGFYTHAGTIALGVENLATWCHELVHAADHRNGTLTKKPGQQPDNEIVAELGGAVLLTMLGEKHEADLGGAWDYVKRYADGDPAKTVHCCIQLVKRTCECVALIMDASSKTESELIAC